jgi:hypothetical protein
MKDDITKHAEERRQARSVRLKDCDAFQAWADCETPQSGGAFGVSLSHHAATQAVKAGLSHDQVSRLRRLYMIVADGQVVTLYRRARPRRDARRQDRRSFKAWGRA